MAAPTLHPTSPKLQLMPAIPQFVAFPNWRGGGGAIVHLRPGTQPWPDLVWDI